MNCVISVASTIEWSRLITGEDSGIRVHWPDPTPILPGAWCLSEYRQQKYAHQPGYDPRIPVEDAVVCFLIDRMEEGDPKAVQILYSGYRGVIAGRACQIAYNHVRYDVDLIATNVILSANAKFDPPTSSYLTILYQETRKAVRQYLSGRGVLALPEPPKRSRRIFAELKALCVPSQAEDDQESAAQVAKTKSTRSNDIMTSPYIVTGDLNDDTASEEFEKIERSSFTAYEKPHTVVQAAADERLCRLASLNHPPHQILATLLVRFAEGVKPQAVTTPPTATLGSLLDLFLEKYCHGDDTYKRHVTRLLEPLEKAIGLLKPHGPLTKIGSYVDPPHPKGPGATVTIWRVATEAKLATVIRDEEAAFLRMIFSEPASSADRPSAHKSLYFALLEMCHNDRLARTQTNQEHYRLFRSSYIWANSQLAADKKEAVFQNFEDLVLFWPNGPEASLKPSDQSGTPTKWIYDFRKKLIERLLEPNGCHRKGLLFGFDRRYLV